MSRTSEVFASGAGGMAGQVLAERRCALYERVADLLLQAEDSLSLGQSDRAREAISDVRHAIRSALAYVTDEVFEELEQLEALCSVELGAGASLSESAARDIRDHLTLLHVKMARCISSPALQDLESVMGLPTRLRQRLEESRVAFRERVRQREMEEQAAIHERQARDSIAAGRHRKAIKQLQKAVQLHPERGVYHNDLGWVFGSIGRLDRAVEEYREAIVLNEANPGQRTAEWTATYFNLGVALQRSAWQVLDVACDEGSDAYANACVEGVRFLEQARDALESYRKTTPSSSRLERTSELLASIDEELQDFVGIQSEAVVTSEEPTA